MSTPLDNKRTAEHLMNLIVTRNRAVPNFSLLLGSGASATSGVRTAQEMIGEWRIILFQRSGCDNYKKWLAKQNWFKHDDEYSILFESIYDQSSQRRVYIEECVKDARPSWGYAYLTNLLDKRFFDAVFTTNFDDLINEAYYQYSDGLHPIVATHDLSIQGIRMTSDRPKIIKLHGDFLYNNIKNTRAELETLEANTKGKKLKQFAQEYGLVVIGYSGRDQSVMDAIELLLREEENYEKGIYWCIRAGETPSGRLESLLRHDRVYQVEVNGFDEFMADLHVEARLELPKAISHPFEMARDRASLLTNVEGPIRSHQVIGAHIKEVQDNLHNITTHEPELPLPIRATILSSRGQFDKAIPIWKQAYKENPSNLSIAHRYAHALADAGRNDDLAEFIHASPLRDDDKTYFLLRSGRNKEVIDMASEILQGGQHDGIEFARINRAIALKRLNRTDEMMKDLEFLEENGDTASSNIKAGVAALKGDKDGMFVALHEALYETIPPRELMNFPVFEDYRDDRDFLDLVRQANQGIDN